MNKIVKPRRRFLRAAARSAAWVAASQILLSGSPAFAAESADLVVRIANPQSDLNGTYANMLVSGGYLKSFGLQPDFSNISDGSKIIAALIGGSVDICGGAGFSGVFPAIEHGAAIKLIGGAQVANFLGLCARDPSIRSAKDLVGKTIGTGAPGAALYQLVVALLEKEGVDYRQVKFVNVGGSPAILRAVVAGIVHAGPCELGYAAHFPKLGIHLLQDGMFSDQLPLYTSEAFYASEAAISTKRDLMVRTLAAYAKLFRFLAGPNSKNAWIGARAAAGTEDPAQTQLEWNFLQKPGRLDTDLVLSQAQIDYMQRLNVMLGEQKAVLSFDKVADMSLAHEAIGLLS